LAELADSRAPREVSELGRALTQQAPHPARVAPLEVLVANGDLDEAVQEPAARAACAAPYLFPLIVALVEVELVEELRPGDEVGVLLFGTEWMPGPGLWFAAALRPVPRRDGRTGRARLYAPRTT
jgi:hypothetical protein